MDTTQILLAIITLQGSICFWYLRCNHELLAERDRLRSLLHQEKEKSLCRQREELERERQWLESVRSMTLDPPPTLLPTKVPSVVASDDDDESPDSRIRRLNDEDADPKGDSPSGRRVS